MSMPKIAIICGCMLVLVGISGALVAMTMVSKWWYALIPAFVGFPLIACGWVAPKHKIAAMIAMHLVPLVAVVGAVGSLMPNGLDFSVFGSVAFVSSIFRLLTIIVCAFVVVRWVRSFVAARKADAG